MLFSGDLMFSVIFDMDGTLLDTQRISIPAWDYAGNRQGVKDMGNQISFVCGMNEAGSSAYVKAKFPEIDITVFKKDVHDYIAKNQVVRFKPGATELIDFLKEYNIKTAVASGSDYSAVRSNLLKVNAFDCFDVIVGGDSVKNGKPSPDIFLHTANMLGVSPESCLVFEDSANGIKAAHSAGMKCIGIPDVVPFSNEIKSLCTELKSFNDAIELLKSLYFQ